MQTFYAARRIRISEVFFSHLIMINDPTRFNLYSMAEGRRIDLLIFTENAFQLISCKSTFIFINQVESISWLIKANNPLK